MQPLAHKKLQVRSVVEKYNTSNSSLLIVMYYLLKTWLITDA